MAALTPENFDKIAEFLSKASEGSIVQAISSLHEYLLEEKLAFKARLSCDFVGVHDKKPRWHRLFSRARARAYQQHRCDRLR